MNKPATISFESAYRQLVPADRGFVDDFVSRVEALAGRNGIDIQEAAGRISIDDLPERDREFLSRALVRSAIAERFRDLTEAENISPRKLIKRAAAIAFATLDHFYDETRDEFEFVLGTPEQRATVKKWKRTENPRTGQIVTEIELKDDVKLLMAFMTQQGLLNNDGEPINADLWRDADALTDDTTIEHLADSYGALLDNG